MPKAKDKPRLRSAIAAALLVVLYGLPPTPLSAQTLLYNSQSNTLPPAASAPQGSLLAPNTLISPRETPLIMPQVAAPIAPVPMVPAGQVALELAARFGKDAPGIGAGLVWRVYAARPDAAGSYRLVKEDKSPAPTLVLPAGSYVVYVGFGLANAVKPVTLRGETVREVLDLPAGGLRLEGRVGDVRIPAGQISFDVYRGSQFEPGDRRPIAERVMTGDVVIVPDGTYYIVSNYGDANSMVRSAIRVQAGKLTDITVTHRAAVITLKLVAEKGGEALANTAWSVLTPGGDVIKESIGAFPRVVLAEGEYRVIARNEGKVFERELKVITGVDGDVEVLAR
jgi:hypothetical protein